MTIPAMPEFIETDLEKLAEAEGRIAVLLGGEGRLTPPARRLDRLMKGALKRFAESEAFSKMKPGEGVDLGWPVGLAAETVQVIRLDRKASVEEARKAGAAVGKALGEKGALVIAGGHPKVAEIAFGAVLRAYDFTAHKTGDTKAKGPIRVMTADPKGVEAEYAPLAALADGVIFARDLVNEPANVLTTTEFAARIKEMEKLDLKVEVLEEKDLEKLGMRTLLAVGYGSESPSKVVVIEWNGGQKDDAPLALVGKGVVFDTGGISIKPAGGMEEMTMDMGGAGVVAGVMRALALRKAKANVVGLVGLVENMPDGRAQRPGDIVRSMKGDTVEVINTDAEGRLVLCDVMWYAQERFKPRGMIDLATLTGAIIIGLGHENAGVFSNDDTLCDAFLKAARAEGEGAWRMPLGEAYDKKLKSRIADMKNVGGRPAGAITAAQFLKRFVKDETPWIHLDIAGVTLPPEETPLAQKGATGWGVMSLNRLVREMLEG
ncbi:leucyl aminopeptidase [Ostreiculturibacter nitratireducens]|uniref:leucyl aminopeptidase n=1 Tax=Ostreiculturibacter nitratireducens TaxID=3075226 RepID=UPI0031B5E587